MPFLFAAADVKSRGNIFRSQIVDSGGPLARRTMSPASIPAAPQPPRKSNNAVWWILGILGGGFAILVLLGLVVVAIFILHVRFDEAGKKVEIETPVGSLKVKSGDERSTGLPVYPDATPEKSDYANIQVSLPQGISVGVAAECYLTQDDLEKVTAWYAHRLGSRFRHEEHGHVAHSSVHTEVNDADVAFISEASDAARVVGLKKTDAGVEISLLRAGKHEVQ